MTTDAPLTSFGPLRHGFVVRPPAAGPAAAPLRLHHLEYGQIEYGGPASDSEVVVLVHGVSGHAGAWVGVGAGLAASGGFRPLAVDLRGHGQSQWSPDHEYSTLAHVDDLLAVLDALDLAQVSLVGSSWGALVALGFAHAHPSRVRRLVLVDIEPSFSQREDEVAPRPHAFATAAEVEAFERGRNPNAPDDVLRAVAAASVRPGPAGLEPWFDPYFFTRWPFRADDWWHAIDTVAHPTLVVHASASFVRGEVTREMAERLPQGRHAEVAPSTHVVPVDAPDALVALLSAFLGEVP
jgi:pimeloyl-ACP methyl ester carboxylesterase